MLAKKTSQLRLTHKQNLNPTFDNDIPLLPAKIPQHSVYAVNGIWDQDAFVHACTDEPRDPLAASSQVRAIVQPHKLVRVCLNLVR